jgi:6,7-dimethyl-8-ribityllumazine synthase
VRGNPPRRHGVTEKKPKIGDKKTKLKVEAPPEPVVAGLSGALNATGKRFAIVVSRFNAFITERLLLSACDGLLRSGAAREDIAVVRVPGAFEIPIAARTLAETKKYDAIICISCLLRGDTAHYDVIVNEVTRGIGQSAQETGVPHAFGVLTCDTLEQAIDRAGLKMGNKGFEAALAAVEMANLKKEVLSSQFSVLRKPAPGFEPSALSKNKGKSKIESESKTRSKTKSKTESRTRSVSSPRRPSSRF